MKTLLTNAKHPEFIPTYEGSHQATHPSVLYFPAGWQGFQYWMAMTPYPYNNCGFEDPSIICSNDGHTWAAPEGVQNPLVPAPAAGHNCDVELVYVPEENALWLYYVEADDLRQSWVKMIKSLDGRHWSKPVTILHDPVYMYSILSPTIVHDAPGRWQMWYVDTGNGGYENQSNAVRTRYSTDGLTWSPEDTCADLLQPGYQLWHLEVRKEAETGMLYALYPAYPNGTNCDDCELFLAFKRPGEPWRTNRKPILSQGESGAWDDFCIYRASGLYHAHTDRLLLWYGGKKKSDCSWNIGFAEGNISAICKNAD